MLAVFFDAARVTLASEIPTRTFKTSATCIDLILGRSKFEYSSKVALSSIADHYLPLMEIKINQPRNLTSKALKIIKLTRECILKMKASLKSHAWEKTPLKNNPTEDYKICI